MSTQNPLKRENAGRADAPGHHGATRRTKRVAEARPPVNGSGTVAYEPPIDVWSYDRSPLTADEHRALDRLTSHYVGGRGGRWPLDTYGALSRLTTPVLELSQALGTLRVGERGAGALGAVLAGMVRFRTSYWEWDASQWRECAEHQRKYSPIKYPVLAVAFWLGTTECLVRPSTCYQPQSLARRVFGSAVVQESLVELRELSRGQGWAVPAGHTSKALFTGTALAMLHGRSPRLRDITAATLEAVRDAGYATHIRVSTLANILLHAGLLDRPLAEVDAGRAARRQSAYRIGIPEVWGGLVERWCNTTTLAPSTRECLRSFLLSTGRWIASAHPEAADPDAWNPDIASRFLRMVDDAKVGQWSAAGVAGDPRESAGHGLRPASKRHWIGGVRTFLLDVQRWKWRVLPNLDPRDDLRTPGSILRLIGPDPRDITLNVWLKLVWASLNLTDAEIRSRCHPLNPPTLVRAVAVIWTHSGLRSDEIKRLTCGCVRDIAPDDVTEKLSPEARALVTFIHVPVNKTSTAFVKPVGKVIARVVEEWERDRPMQQPALRDRKTNAKVHWLFCMRGRPISKTYINRTIIPLLCWKAGLPIEDVPGKRITSHRARASLATLYLNTKEGMSLEELMFWLGHKSMASTRRYARLTPVKQAESFARAHRNTFYVEVLVDGNAVTSGRAAAGQPWQYYDLGHGLCANPFWASCKHRLVCAKCDFYRPNASDEGMYLRAEGNAQRMLVEMPLDAEERAAVNGDLAALEQLLASREWVPTPSGATPAELRSATSRRELPVLQMGPRPVD